MRNESLGNKKNLARIRILHLAPGREATHVDIAAIRIVGTKDIAGFTGHGLGRGERHSRGGNATRRRTGRRSWCVRGSVSCHPRSGSGTGLSLRRRSLTLWFPASWRDVYGSTGRDRIRRCRRRNRCSPRFRPAVRALDVISRGINHAKRRCFRRIAPTTTAAEKDCSQEQNPSIDFHGATLNWHPRRCQRISQYLRVAFRRRCSSHRR
jgi:hypothetical protein